MIPSTYWLARKISSSSLSRRQVVDQACAAAVSAMAPTAITTMKMIRMAPDSRPGRFSWDMRCLLPSNQLMPSTIKTALLETLPELALMDPVQVALTHFEVQLAEVMLRVELASPF